MVRAWGLEPQRITAREPKGDVTSVKGLDLYTQDTNPTNDFS